jgi:hypothetical protein
VSRFKAWWNERRRREADRRFAAGFGACMASYYLEKATIEELESKTYRYDAYSPGPYDFDRGWNSAIAILDGGGR